MDSTWEWCRKANSNILPAVPWGTPYVLLQSLYYDFMILSLNTLVIFFFFLSTQDAELTSVKKKSGNREAMALDNSEALNKHITCAFVKTGYHASTKLHLAFIFVV